MLSIGHLAPHLKEKRTRMNGSRGGAEASSKTSIIYNITAKATTLKAGLVRLNKKFCFCKVEY